MRPTPRHNPPEGPKLCRLITQILSSSNDTEHGARSTPVPIYHAARKAVQPAAAEKAETRMVRSPGRGSSRYALTASSSVLRKWHRGRLVPSVCVPPLATGYSIDRHEIDVSVPALLRWISSWLTRGIDCAMPLHTARAKSKQEARLIATKAAMASRCVSRWNAEYGLPQCQGLSSSPSYVPVSVPLVETEVARRPR